VIKATHCGGWAPSLHCYKIPATQAPACATIKITNQFNNARGHPQPMEKERSRSLRRQGGGFDLWFVVCGLWFAVYSLQFVVSGCGLWFLVFGLWFVVCGSWFVLCAL